MITTPENMIGRTLANPHHFVSAIDCWTERMEKFLDEMPRYDHDRCDEHIAAARNGWTIPACHELPVIGDIETELQFCANGWKKFQRRHFDGER